MAFSTYALFRWIKLKQYQYELTFSLYMLTPSEKFVFNSLIFLLFSMIIIAATLYLPEHVLTIARRVSFYWGGEESAAAAPEAVGAATRAWAGAATPEAEAIIDKLGDL